MSRIDEALRRANAGQATMEEPAATPAVDVTAIARVADYAAEDPFAVQDAVPHAPPAGVAAPQPRVPAPPARVNAPSALGPPQPVTVRATVEGRLITDPTTNRSTVEQFRRLATSMHQLQIERGVKVVMVTSAVPREGKTLTSINLSLALSESYARRVLLIDCDLRRPSVHHVFGLPTSSGLSEGLQSPGGSLPIVQVAPRLTVLPAGRPDPNPFAGFASERMAAVLKEATSRFDWVILDTAPTVVAPDVSLMTNLVDGVLLVIGAGHTDYQAVQQAIADIGHERIMGAVLNGVESESLPVGYYQGYYEPNAVEASGT